MRAFLDGLTAMQAVVALDPLALVSEIHLLRREFQLIYINATHFRFWNG